MWLTMPLYRVVFKNGEKRTLDVEAGWIKETQESYIFLATKHPASKQIAIVPKSQVLYVNKLSEEDC